MDLNEQQHAYYNKTANHSFNSISVLNQEERKKVIKPSVQKKEDITPDTTYLINLQLLGIGYRAYVIKQKQNIASKYNKFLALKVGQSGTTVYPIPNDINIHCPVDAKADKEPIILTSNNLSALKMTVAEIKSYRKLDVYKGSGILECKRIQTSEGEQFITENILRKEIKKKK